jgi:hypothetical protein
MALGVEMMLANLLGMKPDEMRAKVEAAVSLMEQGAKTAAKIESDLAQIKAHLGITEITEGCENVERIAAPSGSVANGNRIQL